MKNPKPYSYVCLLGIDGMGAYHKQCNTPRMDEIFKNGATTYSSVSMSPTISAQNWGSILLGVDPTVHRMTNNSLPQHENTNPDLPSVFSRLRKAFPDAYLASYSNWGAINHGIIEHGIDVDLFSTHPDADLTDKIVECIQKKPKFLFCQFDDIDSAGHSFGYGTPDYLKEIERIDGLAGRIYDAYRNAGILEDTLFLITADHGGIRVGHGDFTDQEKYVFLGASGKYVKKGQIGHARTKDMVAIVLYALGAEVPDYRADGFSSQVPAGIFPELPDTYRFTEPHPIQSASLPTPPIDAPDGLYSFVDRDKLQLAWFCDDKAVDACGKTHLTTKGLTKYYSCGIMNDLAECGNTGFLVTDDLKIGQDFSIALWLKIDSSLLEAVAVCGTQDFFWKNRNMRGLSVSLRRGDVMLTLGNGDDHDDLMVAFPDDIGDGWVHTVFAFDRTAGQIRVFYNFKEAFVCEIDPKYLSVDYNNLPFVIGNDGMQHHNNELYNLNFRMDDFLFFRSALTREEVQKLGKYYHM